jgi:two-component system chemotaxis response regulator CheB
LVGGGEIRLSAGPRINRHRPAVDAMFTSASRWADGRAIAAVLSGALDDGAVGAALVARAGGHVFVQDPKEAAFNPMPLAALHAAPGAVPISVRELGAQVGKLVTAHQERGDRASGADREGAHRMSGQSMEASGDPLYLADDESRITRMRCPECGGPLAQLDLPKISYYRCHVGHQYAPRTLEVAQREAAEARLWSAVSALEEHAALARHLAEESGESENDKKRYLDTASGAADLARSVRAQLGPRSASF